MATSGRTRDGKARRSAEPRTALELTHLGGSRLVVRAGSVLCQRRGTLNIRDQRRGEAEWLERSPERHGIWAFPFPYFDDFFAWHKFDEIVPAHLRNAAISAEIMPLENRLAGMAQRSDEASAEYRALLDRIDQISACRYGEREAWIIRHEHKLLPVRRFWWEGSVYARFDRLGNIHQESWSLLEVGDWQRVARKLEPHNAWTRDHMEIFLARSRGRISG